MGRHTLIELGWLVGGMLLALAVTSGAAWAYPPGKDVIWTVGAVAMLVGVIINMRPLREAGARDRVAERAGD